MSPNPDPRSKIAHQPPTTGEGELSEEEDFETEQGDPTFAGPTESSSSGSPLKPSDDEDNSPGL